MTCSAIPELLRQLLLCHSTPGDEDEVATLLLQTWRQAGWVTRGHGRYAVTAQAPWNTPGKPIVLLCAHMDSPGFTVESRHGDCLRLVRLGGVTLPEREAAGVIRTVDGPRPVTILQEEGDDGNPVYWMPFLPPARHGDRVCFQATPTCDVSGRVRSPFLDNRLGCFALCELTSRLAADCGVNVVLGATASEEVGGFGAAVMARMVQPTLAICLDATYAAADQGVVLGGGPVLTLSDASVLLAPRVRDAVLEVAFQAGIPLQTEVYNYSGTDAKAFPQQGLPALVLPVLIASEGNHSPSECADLGDVHCLGQLLQALCAAPALEALATLEFAAATEPGRHA